MVIIGAIEVGRVREAVDEYIVSCLDMEGLLDFGVGSDKEVEEDQSGKKEGENDECYTN